MACQKKLSTMTAAQNFERHYTPRSMRLTYKDYKRTADLGIVKFFSLRTVYTNCKRLLFITKTELENLQQ